MTDRPASNWQIRCQLCSVTKNIGLVSQGDIFDRAYAYIQEHY